MKSKHTLPKAVSVLKKELKNNPDYWESWMANIAMAFYDEYCRRKYLKPYLNLKQVHACANVAADNFLKLLTKY